MDRLEQLFTEREDKVQMLKQFIVLFGKKSEVYGQLVELYAQNVQNYERLDYAKEALKRQKQMIPIIKYNMKTSDCLLQSMLNMIEELIERDEKQNVVPRKEAGQHNGNHLTVSDVRTPTSNLRSKSPSIYLSDYKCSPHARTMKPLALQFTDFEASISLGDFSKIPQYMKGRETLEELRHFLDSVIIKCFTSKYTLMHKHRDVVRNQQDLNMWRHFHQQADYFPNRLFITQGDISQVTGKMVDKKTANRIAMLRHIQVLQEMRHKSTVCYIWLAK